MVILGSPRLLLVRLDTGLCLGSNRMVLGMFVVVLWMRLGRCSLRPFGGLYMVDDSTVKLMKGGVLTM